MPAIVRQTIDNHSGHASSTSPFHRTPYIQGSINVKINGFGVVTVGDETECGDIAKDGSPKVFVNKKGVHRVGDATTGHDDWQPNFAATGSHDVFADDIRLGVISIKGTPRTLADVEEERTEVIELIAGGDARDEIEDDADISAEGALFGASQFGRGSFGGTG